MQLLLLYSVLHFIFLTVMAVWLPLFLILQHRLGARAVSGRIDAPPLNDDVGPQERRQRRQTSCLWWSFAVCSSLSLAVGAIVLSTGWLWVNGGGWETEMLVGGAMRNISGMYGGIGAVVVMILSWMWSEARQQLAVGNRFASLRHGYAQF